MKIYSLTDVGRKRKENQDNYWIARLDSNGTEIGVMCLCDGMGGLSNGEQASHIIVEAVREFFKENLDIQGLNSVIKEKNKEIYELGKQQGKPMGTTCTVALIKDDKCRILHVGDSRLYKWSETEGTRLLTTDHSALNKFKITKESNPELYKKYKNMLTRCVGINEDVQIDFYTDTCKKGEKLLICSDGFWHFFKERDMGIPLRLSNLRLLVDECMQSGELDNITVAVLEV